MESMGVGASRSDRSRDWWAVLEGRAGRGCKLGLGCGQNLCEGPEQGPRLIDDLLAADQFSRYHLAHPARADLCRGRVAEARASYEKALALATQESDRRFSRQAD